jgi:hypothetical protein
MIYEERSDGWWDSAENKPLHLVVWYQAALWIEWRKSDTEFASAGSETIFDKWVADSGLTEEADIDKTYYSSPEFNTYADIFFPWVAEPGPYLYLDIWVDPPASLWNGAYLYDNYGNRLLYSTDALSETDNYLYDSVFDYRKTYIEDWDDIGVLAEGWPNPLLINGEYEALSGRATFKSFGLMDGSVETTESLEEGSQVQVARGGDILFTGIVTEARVSLVDGVYSVSVSDPVTAGGGEVEYTSGNAITAMQEAIEACGGTFETDMDTEETVFYPETPVDAWQFFRAVSYAVGGVLQYGRDGVYRLVEGGSGHSVTDAIVIGDDRPTVEERTKDYANRVAASIDQEWRTEAVENTIETFTSPGAGYAEITRFGEQIISQEVNFSGGSQTTYTHDYDENGYCIKTIEEEEGAQEIGSMKRVRTLEFTDISEDGNEYKASDVIETYNYGYSPISEENGWILIARTTLNWDVNLDGISFVEEIEQGTTPIGGGSVLLETDDGGGGTVNLSVPICSGFEVAWPELWNRRRWVASIVTSPVAGPIEGFTSCTEYSWTEVGINADPGSALGFCSRLGWYQLPSRSDKSYTVPKLEVYAPEDTHEVHILAKAEDPDAIDALGEYEYECQAVSLDTETGMQAFALGVLFEKGRIRHANVSVPNDDYLALDTVIWRGLEWLIDSVIVDLDRCCDVIEMVTTSTLARLQNSISREPVSWIEDVKNVVTKKTALYDNVARGRIMSQVGFRRYLVQAEGKATPIEAKALTDDPHLVDGSVLLVKPSGKGQPWTLLSLSKEQTITMPATMTASVTPPMEGGYVFYIPPTVWTEPTVPQIRSRQAVFEGVPVNEGYWSQVKLPEILQGANAAFRVRLEGELSFDYTVPEGLSSSQISEFGINFKVGSMVLATAFYVSAIPLGGGKVQLTLVAPDQTGSVDLGWRKDDGYHFYVSNYSFIESSTEVDEGSTYNLTRPFDVTARVLQGGLDLNVETSLSALTIFIGNDAGDGVRQTCKLGFDENDGIEPHPDDPYIPYPPEVDDGLCLSMRAGGTYTTIMGEFLEWLPMTGHVMTGWARATLYDIGVLD